VDGTARKAHRGMLNWNSKKDRTEMSAFSEEMSYEVEPGDVIAIPENYERVAWMRELRDITQILMNTAVAAGVVIKLF
jgi:polysaccharide biosynthesis/export protein